MRFLIFSILIISLSACCDDNANCYMTNTPMIQLVYDNSSNGFSREAIDSSYILVINDSSNLIVDTLFFEKFYDSKTQNINEIEELARNRQMKNHRYIFQIDAVSDTIKNINYTSKETVKDCREPCFPREKFEVIVDEYFDFQYNFKGETISTSRLYITK